ncbi:MAG: MxaK protein [Methylococcales bacterium]|nr:MxaK protein [Methylococcales bacterium]
MLRRLRHPLLWGALALSLSATLYQAAALYRVQHDNDLISQLTAGQAVDIGPIVTGPPELRLARAYYFKQKHRYDEALSTLSLIVGLGDPQFQALVRYNLGNLYLEQAVTASHEQHINTAAPLAGLAKQAYRQSLALDSSNWDAKYNLEVAMRLLPEMDVLIQAEDSNKNQKTQLWTTVPGFPRGLP